MLELDKHHYRAQIFLTVAAVFTFTVVLVALVITMFFPMVDVAAGVKELIVLVLGALLMVYKEVYGFWFGSSAGSLRKSIMEKPGEPPAGG